MTLAYDALLVTDYDARWLGPQEDPPWTKISGRELSRHLTQIPARIGKERGPMRANGT